MLLEMHDGILYGPVNSRRLGKSLGINLSPARDKLCSFNCLYCHYGWTRRHILNFDNYANELPSATDVIQAVEGAVQSEIKFAYITFSGNGEPSLHPNFPEIAARVVELRDQYRPEVKTAILTNSTGLMLGSVRKAIRLIDRPFLKLDAGTKEVFRKVNRPAEGVRFQEIVEHMVALDGVFTQTVFVDGAPSNTTDEELAAWFGHIKRIKPVEAHIYSIDRPVPDHDIRLVPPDRLEEIAEQGQKETGVAIKAYYPRYV